MILAALACVISCAAASDVRFEDEAFTLSMRPVDEACGTMEQWVAAHPDGDDAARAMLWVARLRLESQDRPRARLALTRGAQGKTRTAYEARRILVAMDLEDGALDAAAAGADSLAAVDDARAAAAGALLQAKVRGLLLRRALTRAAIAFLVVDVVIRAARTGRRMWPPPFEVAVAVDDARAHLDALAAQGVFTVAFGGGEPLLHRDVYELAAYARGLGLWVTVTTAGFVPVDERLRVFHAVHVSFTPGGPAAVARAARVHDRVGINVIATSVDDVAAAAACAKQLGVAQLQVMQLRSVGRAAHRTALAIDDVIAAVKCAVASGVRVRVDAALAAALGALVPAGASCTVGAC